jgi:hypothetical protein
MIGKVLSSCEVLGVEEVEVVCGWNSLEGKRGVRAFYASTPAELESISLEEGRR